MKRIHNYITTNSILFSLAILQSVCPFPILYLFLRNHFIVWLIEYGLRNKSFIDKKPRHNSFPFFHLMVLTYSILEYYSIRFLNPSKSFTIWDIVLFIPYSFVVEVIFDLFHYSTHRMLHMHKSIYQIHKHHHQFPHPTVRVAYYHHPIDLLLTNWFGFIATMMIMNSIYPASSVLLNAVLVYKNYGEISGHAGKEIRTSCFPQCIYLPRLLGIELRIEDHDLHHSKNRGNYAKRFSLWDKIFGTYITLPPTKE